MVENWDFLVFDIGALHGAQLTSVAVGGRRVARRTCAKNVGGLGTSRGNGTGSNCIDDFSFKGKCDFVGTLGSLVVVNALERRFGGRDASFLALAQANNITGGRFVPMELP